MQREREEILFVRNGLMIGVRNLEQQLAASERTCAELRERFERCNEMRERQFTRVEAADLTVQFLSQAHKEFWEENSSDTLHALGPTAVFNSIKSRAAELARLEGGCG